MGSKRLWVTVGCWKLGLWHHGKWGEREFSLVDHCSMFLGSGMSPQFGIPAQGWPQSDNTQTERTHTHTQPNLPQPQPVGLSIYVFIYLFTCLSVNAKSGDKASFPKWRDNNTYTTKLCAVGFSPSAWSTHYSDLAEARKPSNTHPYTHVYTRIRILTIFVRENQV